MKFINDYWKIITSIILATLAAGALQAQVAQNKADIEEGHGKVEKILKYADRQDAKIILAVQKENETVRRQTEKDYEENKKEIEKLKAKQEAQTVLEVKVGYIIDGLKEMQQSIKGLATEIREKRK